MIRDQVLTTEVLRRWARAALAALAVARAEIDELNVYPVPDGDTGTNLYLTWEAACEALPSGDPTFAEAVQAFGRGALLGARGNSGVITSQLIRACGHYLSEHLAHLTEAPAGRATDGSTRAAADGSTRPAADSTGAAAEGSSRPGADSTGAAAEGSSRPAADSTGAAADGSTRPAADSTGAAAEGSSRPGADSTGAAAEHAGQAAGPVAGGEAAVFAEALVFAADAAYGAVAQPVEGTMLTVAREAARAARAAADDGSSLAEVCRAAVAAGREALGRTTEQLEPLRRAGVVDAGGAGLVVILGAMESVLSGRAPGRESGVPARVPTSGPPEVAHDLGPDGPAYEVMYLLEAPDEVIGALRRELDGLGDSVVVVGGDGLWNVHVHTDDVGAAVECGIEAGRPYRIRVTHFADAGVAAPRPGRAVIAVVAGDGLAKLFTEAGASVVSGGPGRRCSTGELLAAIERAGAPEVVLLPNDKDSIGVAEAAATAARQDGLRVAVIPTRAQVQGLAAIAVHDPLRSFDDDVVHLSAAAGQTRHGAVTIAVKDAWTMAGTCRIGDALGVVDGDFALITEDLETAATGVVDRLLGGGGELMTVVRGRDGTPALVDAVVRHVRRSRRDVDVVVYDGGQDRYPLLIGVE